MDFYSVDMVSLYEEIVDTKQQKAEEEVRQALHNLLEGRIKLADKDSTPKCTPNRPTHDEEGEWALKEMYG